jgi:diguanylate cyclase (GGDEF)-like protein/PAS domain S-box-containing protein
MMGHLMELNSPTMEKALFWSQFQYMGIAVAPSAWLAFIMQYVGKREISGWPLRLGLIIPPILTIFLAWTNPSHGLLYGVEGWITTGQFRSIEIEYGPFLWAFVAYAYLLVGYSTFLTYRLLRNSHPGYRLQVLATMLAALFPWAASVHDVLQLEPLPNLELTPLAFSLTAITLTWNLLRWRMADLIPVARDVVFEGLLEAVFVLDRSGRVVDCNALAQSMLNLPPSDIIGVRLAAHWEPVKDMVKEYSETSATRAGVEKTIQLVESTYQAQLSRLHNQQQEFLGLLLVLRDVTEQKRIEEALRRSEERYALAARGASDGLWDWDLKSDRVYYSPRWAEMLGMVSAEADGLPNTWFDRVHVDDRPGLQRAIDDHLAGKSEHLEHESRMISGSGEYRWMLCRGVAVLDERDNPIRFAGSLTDITDRKRAEEQLKHDALHDALTGLPNRVLLRERVEHAIHRLHRNPKDGFALLLLDLDRFKVINDSMGHLLGDWIICAVADRLQGVVREVDTVARLGGDEFVILLDSVKHVGDATRAAKRVELALAQPFMLGDQEIFTTASIGIAQGTTRYVTHEEVVRDADIALYRAKDNGRGRYEMFDMAMHDEAMAELELEIDLRAALHSQEFFLVYQPIYRLADGQISGVEALLRWDHPRRGVLAPGEFLKSAEETGMIVPIGTWVLRQACSQLKAWQDSQSSAQDLSVSVNLSSAQLEQGDLVQIISHILNETGLSPESLRLELTENIVMQDSNRARRQLVELKALGIRAYIDDFGTGYSSLGVLHTFPVDALKIDRSFVNALGSEHREEQLVQAIMTLAQGLEIEVIAEGVETAVQLEHLQSIDCDFAQGYLLSHPARAAEIEALLSGKMVATDPTPALKSVRSA